MKQKKIEKNFNTGVLQLNNRLYKEAIASFSECIFLGQNVPEVYSNRGMAYYEIGLSAEAIKDYHKAIQINPNYAEAYCNLGVTFNRLKQFDKAIFNLKKALYLSPMLTSAVINLGISYRNLLQLEDAHQQFEVALILEPNNELIYFQQGLTFFSQKQYEKAFECYDQAIFLKPNFVDALFNAAIAFLAIKNPNEAIKILDQVILVNPKFVAAYTSKYEAFLALKKYKEASEVISQGLEVEPELNEGLGKLLNSMLMLCNWSDFDNLKAKILSSITHNKYVTQPFYAINLVDDPGVLKKCATNFSRLACESISQKNPLKKYVRHPRIRLGFFSSDFQEHPIAHLTSELFEKIDRSQFEIFAFSFGDAPHHDLYRARLMNAFDKFIDIKELSDINAVNLSRQHEIDIAIDLNGHTGNARTNLFALRVAPVQIHHLGFVGTMGADFMDYIVADKTVIPFDQQEYYSEKIIYLPCYQPNDSKRDISSKEMRRADFGLKEDGFVFCCFNNNYKITPDIFDSWMRILIAASESQLWLIDSGEANRLNLRKEAQARGVSPDRIIFAKNIPVPEYLSRFKLADLFLDTYPYNAGTVGSDALRMGLPLLTLCGNTFSSRMAASLLHAINLNDLIAHSKDKYESLAISMYKDHVKYSSIKTKLIETLPQSSLFDIERFTRSIEEAFTDIYERHQAGEKPQNIIIED